MDLATALVFVRTTTRSVLVTIRGTAAPQLSNVLHAVFDDGTIRISTTTVRAKARNLAREPWAALHVTQDDFWAYAVLEATVELTPAAADPNDAVTDMLVEHYRAAVRRAPTTGRPSASSRWPTGASSRCCGRPAPTGCSRSPDRRRVTAACPPRAGRRCSERPGLRSSSVPRRRIVRRDVPGDYTSPGEGAVEAPACRRRSRSEATRIQAQYTKAGTKTIAARQITPTTTPTHANQRGRTPVLNATAEVAQTTSAPKMTAETQSR